MAVSIPWSQSEAVLLVDAYFMIENGTISRKLAVQLVSEELRKRATLLKMKIDAVFRNTNGINMRFYEIQYIASNGETGMKNTSKLFIETVKQHSDNIADFQREYQEALAEIYGNKVSAFKQWIEHGRYVNTAKAIEYSLRILEIFGNKEGLIMGSFCNIADLTMIENLGQVICNNTAFKKYKS